MNLGIFGGNFVRDPELKKVGAEGISVVNFTIALNKYFTSRDNEKKKDVTFIDCEAWDSGAETIARNCVKGDYIIVYTSAKNSNYTDKDGNKRSRVKFRVDRFEFVPGTRRHIEAKVEEPEPQEQNDDDIPF